MKNYITLKPCRFQGVNYKIGEKISEPEKILPVETSTAEEIKKPKKKSKAGDENDVQL